MRQARRGMSRALTRLSVLLLVTCLLIEGLSCWSHIASEHWWWGGEAQEFSVAASRGRLEFWWGEPSRDEGSKYRPGFSYGRAHPPAEFNPYVPADFGTNWTAFDRGGFVLVRGEVDGLRQWSLILPCWFIVAALAARPVSQWMIGRRKARASATGRCADCGYDLLATPDRCPECGLMPA